MMNHAVMTLSRFILYHAVYDDIKPFRDEPCCHDIQPFHDEPCCHDIESSHIVPCRHDIEPFHIVPCCHDTVMFIMLHAVFHDIEPFCPSASVHIS